jgi:hypothetical protein
MEINEYLTESEKARLKQFTKDEIMVKAVQKVLLSCVYFEGTLKKDGIPSKNFILDIVSQKDNNEELGAEVRAVYQAIILLTKGFAELKQFSKEERREKEKKNPAI